MSETQAPSRTAWLRALCATLVFLRHKVSPVRHSVGSARAAARRHHHPPALAGAARRAGADRRAAADRRGARRRRLRAASRSPAAASSTRAVRRGVESPWERIRALKARTTTPLGLALRGRFLVGSRPVGADFVRRFVASAAENGIDVFRLHDPLNDVSNLREAGEAIVAAGQGVPRRPRLQPGRRRARSTSSSSRRSELPELGATRALVHDPTGGLEPHQAGELVAPASRRRPAFPVGFYCQGAGGHRARRLARGRAGRRRPDRLRRLPARALAPPRRRRVARLGARRDGPRHRRRRRAALGGRPTSSTSTSATSP